MLIFENTRTEIPKLKAGHDGAVPSPHLRQETGEDESMIPLWRLLIQQKSGTRLRDACPIGNLKYLKFLVLIQILAGVE